jgi:dysferlin
VGHRVYNLADFEVSKPTHTHLGSADQRLALHVLNTLPASMKIPLVPEHVETRPLYNPLQPGIEQVRIEHCAK